MTIVAICFGCMSYEKKIVSDKYCGSLIIWGYQKKNRQKTGFTPQCYVGTAEKSAYNWRLKGEGPSFQEHNRGHT